MPGSKLLNYKVSPAQVVCIKERAKDRRIREELVREKPKTRGFPSMCVFHPSLKVKRALARSEC